MGRYKKDKYDARYGDKRCKIKAERRHHKVVDQALREQESGRAGWGWRRATRARYTATFRHMRRTHDRHDNRKAGG